MSNRHLNETATLWVATGSNGQGGKTYATPVLINCRWEYAQEKFTSAEGEEVVSRAVVYVDRQIATGDLLSQADYVTGATVTAPRDTLTSRQTWEVRAYSEVTNLRRIEKVRRVFL